jgi:predicted acyl esterase
MNDTYTRDPTKKDYTMKASPFYTFLFLVLVQFSVWSEVPTPDVTVMVPMRDGISLPTDLYLPNPEAKGLPCVLLRSPAGRQAWASFAVLAKEGYCVAIQDTRSVLDVEGKTFPFMSDGWGKLQDGYDAVEWLAKSPYTNGKIGTWGASALGITQLLMAPTAPPHLECQYILIAAASLYHQGLFPGGILLKHQAESWLGYYARDTGVLSYICQRPFYNEFWRQLNTIEQAPKIRVPAMHIGGWYDTFLQGSLTAFTSRQNEGGEGAKGKQKLVIGPWTHFWPQSKVFGDFEVPVAGHTPPLDISPKRWFDYYLKGKDNGMENIPPILYYVMGPFDGSPSSGNLWRSASSWPVPSVETPYYLTKEGALQTETPLSSNLTYTYDPHHPIPTLGGRNLFLQSGPMDQRPIESRKDVLVFTTKPLQEDLEVTGNLVAKIYFVSSQQDTDIVVRLMDVYPDGRSVLISDGGYRLGVLCQQEKKVQPLDPSQPVEATVDLAATSLVFAKGHSIRVSVSSSNYPRYEKNMNVGILGSNTGQVNQAVNTIYMGKDYPSSILLPIARQGDVWLKEKAEAFMPASL